MKALSKKTVKSREMRLVNATAETMLKIAILTADDVFGVDEESINKFIAIYRELILEYGSLDNGVELINQELLDRDINVLVKRKEQK